MPVFRRTFHLFGSSGFDGQVTLIFNSDATKRNPLPEEMKGFEDARAFHDNMVEAHETGCTITFEANGAKYAGLEVYRITSEVLS